MHVYNLWSVEITWSLIQRGNAEWKIGYIRSLSGARMPFHERQNWFRKKMSIHRGKKTQTYIKSMYVYIYIYIYTYTHIYLYVCIYNSQHTRYQHKHVKNFYSEGYYLPFHFHYNQFVFWQPSAFCVMESPISGFTALPNVFVMEWILL